MTKHELDLLRAAHQRNADKLGYIIGNFGWVIHNNQICSKTSQGYLTSTRHGYRNYEHKLQTN